jgi:hypothetical protein
MSFSCNPTLTDSTCSQQRHIEWLKREVVKPIASFIMKQGIRKNDEIYTEYFVGMRLRAQ